MESFRSNRSLSRPPRGRERAIPEVHDAVSVYKTAEQARDLWLGIKEKHPNPRIGNYIAEVRLEAGEDFMLEDLDEPDGHVEVWGDALKLAESVVDISPAEGILGGQ